MCCYGNRPAAESVGQLVDHPITEHLSHQHFDSVNQLVREEHENKNMFPDIRSCVPVARLNLQRAEEDGSLEIDSLCSAATDSPPRRCGGPLWSV